MTQVPGIDRRLHRLGEKLSRARSEQGQSLLQLRNNARLDEQSKRLETLHRACNFATDFNRGPLTKVSTSIRTSSSGVRHRELLNAMAALQEVIRTPFGQSVLQDLNSESAQRKADLEKAEVEITGAIDKSKERDIERRIESQTQRKTTMEAIKASDAYKVLTEAKKQRVSLTDEMHRLEEGDHEIPKQLEELFALRMDINRELKTLNETEAEDLTGDALILQETLGTAKIELAKKIHDLEESFFQRHGQLKSELKNNLKVIAEHQNTVEEMVRQQITR